MQMTATAINRKTAVKLINDMPANRLPYGRIAVTLDKSGKTFASFETTSVNYIITDTLMKRLINIWDSRAEQRSRVDLCSIQNSEFRIQNYKVYFSMLEKRFLQDCYAY